MAKKKKLTATQKEKRRLARKIRSNVRELNRQLGIINREIARGTYAPHYDTVDTTLEMMRKLTNTKSAKKFATGRLSHMSLADLQELESYSTHVRTQKKVFNTTQRRVMFNRAWQTMNDRYFGGEEGLSRQEYRALLTLFNDRTLSEYREQHMLDSEQLISFIAEVKATGNPQQAAQNLIEAFKQANAEINLNVKKFKLVFNNNAGALREFVNIYYAHVNNKIDVEERDKRLEEFKNHYNL